MASDKPNNPDEKTGSKKKYKYYKGSFVVGKKPDGTPERVYVRGRTKAERDEKLTEIKRLHGRGMKLGEMTVREWSEVWLAVYKANVTVNQKAHYESKLNHDILPIIGTMKMKDVRASHLQGLINTYQDGKKGTVSKIRIALRQLFGDAEVEGIIERSPAIKIEMPEVTEDARRPLTIPERLAVLKVAETHPRGPYVLLMLYCGLRRGECIALEREDVDLKNKKLTVSKALNFQMNVGQLSGTKASKLRKKVKTDEDVGVRVIPIPDVLIPVLKPICERKKGSDILFPKSDGKYATQQTCRWWWQSFSRQCHIATGAELYRNAIKYETSKFGQEVSPHYLRHTYATDLYAAEVDEKARKSFLGHSSNDVTDIYTQMSDDAFNRAAEQFNEYLNFERWLFPGIK